MGIFDKLKRNKEEKKEAKKAAEASDAKETASKKSTPAKKDQEKKEKNVEPAAAKPLGDLHGVLLMPMLTEKSFKLQQENKYCFYVAQDANKFQVQSAMKEVYGIAPLSVNILRKRPQTKKRWGRKVGMTKGWKKAIVTMPEGTVLNLTD